MAADEQKSQTTNTLSSAVGLLKKFDLGNSTYLSIPLSKNESITAFKVYSDIIGARVAWVGTVVGSELSKVTGIWEA